MISLRLLSVNVPAARPLVLSSTHWYSQPCSQVVSMNCSVLIIVVERIYEPFVLTIMDHKANVSVILGSENLEIARIRQSFIYRRFINLWNECYWIKVWDLGIKSTHIKCQDLYLALLFIFVNHDLFLPLTTSRLVQHVSLAHCLLSLR